MSKKYTGHWCLRPSNVRVRYRADLHRKLSLHGLQAGVRFSRYPC